MEVALVTSAVVLTLALAAYLVYLWTALQRHKPYRFVPFRDARSRPAPL